MPLEIHQQDMLAMDDLDIQPQLYITQKLESHNHNYLVKSSVICFLRLNNVHYSLSIVHIAV
jgi:hypothetical protein